MQAPPTPLASLRGEPSGLSPPLVQDGYRDEGGWARLGRKVMPLRCYLGRSLPSVWQAE